MRRNIEPGEEVTDSYGMTFIETPKHQRQKRFKKQYKFVCRCRACEENYTTFDKLEKGVSDNLGTLITRNLNRIDENLVKGDSGLALKNAISFSELVRCLPPLHAVRQRSRVLIATCLRMNSAK